MKRVSSTVFPSLCQLNFALTKREMLLFCFQPSDISDFKFRGGVSPTLNYTGWLFDTNSWSQMVYERCVAHASNLPLPCISFPPPTPGASLLHTGGNIRARSRGSPLLSQRKMGGLIVVYHHQLCQKFRASRLLARGNFRARFLLRLSYAISRARAACVM